MRDPYEVLGVAKTATAKDIKQAYRKLAKKYHPDQNPDDPKAKERFSAANQAYEIVGDEKKRAAFDRGEIDGDGKPRHPGLRRRRRRRRSLRRLPPAAGGRAARAPSSAAAMPATSSARFSARPLPRRPRRCRSRRLRPARGAAAGATSTSRSTSSIEEVATRRQGQRRVPRRAQARGQAAGLCRGRPDDPPEGAGRAGRRPARRRAGQDPLPQASRATGSRGATCMSTAGAARTMRCSAPRSRSRRRPAASRVNVPAWSSSDKVLRRQGAGPARKDRRQRPISTFMSASCCPKRPIRELER